MRTKDEIYKDYLYNRNIIADYVREGTFMLNTKVADANKTLQLLQVECATDGHVFGSDGYCKYCGCIKTK